MPLTIAASILAADLSNLHRQISLAEEGGADWIHIDVMDGRFVPNITFGPVVVKAARKCTRLPLDVHLMVERPELHLAAFRDAGADLLTVHAEASPHLHRTVQQIHELGLKAGVAINPATPVATLLDILMDIDLVLVMSVNPGFGGQAFIPTAAKKLRSMRSMLADVNPFIHLEVDGGIDHDTASIVAEAGANVLVSGNYIFSAPSIPDAVRRLRSGAETTGRR